MTPWIFFVTEHTTALKKTQPDVKQTELMSQAAKTWSEMTDKQKQPYVKLSEGDKVRHDKQVEEKKQKGFFFLEDKTKSTDPANAKLFKKRKSVDSESDEESKELKPKRACSSYIFFATEHTAQLKKEHPDKKHTELMAMAG